MNILYRSLVSLMLCTALYADIVPIPGTHLVAPVFEKSDVVCSCLVLSADVTSEENLNPPPKQVVLRHMRAVVEVKDSFKANNVQPGDRVAVQYDVEEPSTRGSLPSIVKSETALLFLRRTESGNYVFADPYLGATHFNALPPSPDGVGLTKLQSALVKVIRQNDRNDQIRALRLLEGLNAFRPDTVSALNSLTNSPDPEIALSSIAVLLKTKTPESVEILRRYLETYSGDARPVALLSIGSELGQVRDAGALSAVEALSGSKYLSIKFGAIDALRTMRSPSSAPVLIQRLDDSNNDIRYFALITLAEIFGKSGDYAPLMRQFHENPEKHVALWKDWWSQTGSRLPPRPPTRIPTGRSQN